MGTNVKSAWAKDHMTKISGYTTVIVGAITAITSVYGFGVKSGMLPALTIGYGTKQPVDVSVRVDEISSLKDLVSTLSGPSNQSYIVVEGDKGIGKSCLIETALKDTKGVVKVPIPTGFKQQEVFEKVTRAITAPPSAFIFGSAFSAVHAINWHRSLFRVAPTVVLSASEVPEDSANENPAQLTGAVRILTEMGLRVIIDASPNSLPKGILTTGRARVIHVDYMTSEQIRLLPQVVNLFDRLNAHPGLFDVVYDLLGGNPLRFVELSEKLSLRNADPDVRTAVEALCVERLGDVEHLYNSLVENEPKWDDIFSLLKTNKALSRSVLKANGVKLPNPSKLLQSKGDVEKGDMVIPKTPMAAFFFENNCDYPASKKVLHKLIWEPPTPSPPPTSQPSGQP